MIFMIAHVVENNKLIGFRLLDNITNQVMNTPYGSVVEVLQSNKANIENIKISGGKLLYSPRLDNYTKVDRHGNLISKQSYVMVREVGNEYLISDYLGRTQYISKYELEGIPIANMSSYITKEDTKIVPEQSSKTGIRSLASKLGHKIKSHERDGEYTDRIVLKNNYMIYYSINGNSCLIALKDETRQLVDKIEFTIHSNNGWSIVDVYIANILKLLRLMV